MKDIKKSLLVAFIAFCLVLNIVGIHITNGILSKAYKPYKGIHVVIDAGHGLPDGGARFGGIDESDINLSIAKKLKNELEQLGMKVTFTRSDKNDLVERKHGSVKREDMKKRIAIINQDSVDFLISIHLNSYADASVSGSQIFYAKKDEDSHQFANDIQKEVVKLTKSKLTQRAGDYYILNQSNKISILLECGFISNKKEREKLLTNNYQSELAQQIRKGMMTFLKRNYE